MAKKKTTNASNKPQAKKKIANSLTQQWRKKLETGLFTLAIVVMFAFVYAVYNNSQAVEQDLSVIGNGTPTVVQIHDPGCQLCRRLKKNLDSVASDFKPDIQFKIANIKKDQGRRFADSHGVPHVTLLFFDKAGKKVETIQGVTPAEDIRLALATLARTQ